MDQDALALMLTNLSQILSNLDQTVYVLAAIIGLTLIGLSLLKLKDSAQKSTPVLPHILTLLLGTLLFSLKAFIDAASLSLFEQEAALSQELNQIAVANIYQPYINFAVTVTVILGIIAVPQGLLRLRAASLGQPEYFWPGLTHLLAGIACINIVTLTRIIANSIGGAFANIISKIIG